MEIPLKFQISDNRDSNFYKNKTFCGYKKINVFHALEKSLLEGKLEDSIAFHKYAHSYMIKNISDSIIEEEIPSINIS